MAKTDSNKDKNQKTEEKPKPPKFPANRVEKGQRPQYPKDNG